MSNIVLDYNNTFIWITKHNKEIVLNKINKMFKGLKTNIINIEYQLDDFIILFQKSTYAKTLKAFGRDTETFYKEFDLKEFKEIDLNGNKNIFQYKD